jgi:hypothetical protein
MSTKVIAHRMTSTVRSFALNKIELPVLLSINRTIRMHPVNRADHGLPNKPPHVSFFDPKFTPQTNCSPLPYAILSVGRRRSMPCTPDVAAPRMMPPTQSRPAPSLPSSIARRQRPRPECPYLTDRVEDSHGGCMYCIPSTTHHPEPPRPTAPAPIPCLHATPLQHVLPALQISPSSKPPSRRLGLAAAVSPGSQERTRCCRPCSWRMKSSCRCPWSSTQPGTRTPLPVLPRTMTRRRHHSCQRLRC